MSAILNYFPSVCHVEFQHYIFLTFNFILCVLVYDSYDMEYFDMPMADAKFGYSTEFLLTLPCLEGLVARLSVQMPTILPIAACKDLQWALGQILFEVLPAVCSPSVIILPVLHIDIYAVAGDGRFMY
jgi:hypothetical protein